MKDIRYLKGVGEKRAGLLNKLGIFTIEQLLEYYPRDYRDFRAKCLFRIAKAAKMPALRQHLSAALKSI